MWRGGHDVSNKEMNAMSEAQLRELELCFSRTLLILQFAASMVCVILALHSCDLFHQTAWFAIARSIILGSLGVAGLFIVNFAKTAVLHIRIFSFVAVNMWLIFTILDIAWLVTNKSIFVAQECGKDQFCSYKFSSTITIAAWMFVRVVLILLSYVLFRTFIEYLTHFKKCRALIERREGKKHASPHYEDEDLEDGTKEPEEGFKEELACVELHIVNINNINENNTTKEVKDENINNINENNTTKEVKDENKNTSKVLGVLPCAGDNAQPMKLERLQSFRSSYDSDEEKKPPTLFNAGVVAL